MRSINSLGSPRGFVEAGLHCGDLGASKCVPPRVSRLAAGHTPEVRPPVRSIMPQKLGNLQAISGYTLMGMIVTPKPRKAFFLGHLGPVTSPFPSAKDFHRDAESFSLARHGRLSNTNCVQKTARK